MHVEVFTLLALLMLSRCRCFLHSYYAGPKQALFRIYSDANSAIRAVDPLDFLTVDQTAYGKSTGYRKSTPDNDSSDNKLFTNLTDTSKHKQLDKDLESTRKSILKSLPVTILDIFYQVVRIFMPRLALIMLTVHVMLLIPILRFVLLELHSSVYQYLYIGPFICFFPYLYFWLWENNLMKSELLDNKLFNIIKGLSDLSNKKYNDEFRNLEESLLKIQDVDETKLEQLAYVQVLMDVDSTALFEEIKYLLRENVQKGNSFTSESLSDSISGRKFVQQSSNDTISSLIEIQSKLASEDNKKVTINIINTIDRLFNTTLSSIDVLSKRQH